MASDVILYGEGEYFVSLVKYNAIIFITFQK